MPPPSRSVAPTLRIPARYNGPPHSANGGWVSGRLAQEVVAGAVTVRLRTPPPLDRDLALRPVAPVADGGGGAGHPGDAAGVELWDDGRVSPAGPGSAHEGVLVASAAPAGPDALRDDVVPPVSFAEAEASGSAYEGLLDHPFPTCFVCGTARPDGLSLRPGRVAGGGGEYAAAWVPTDVTVPVVWAAMDCPGGWSAGIAGRPMVLGTMTARIDALPAAGDHCVVMAWPRGSQGRRFLSGTALYSPGGRLLARAEAIWIAVDPGSVRPHQRG